MTNNVFGVFVGEGGCYLSDFNSQNPYPPIKDNEGFLGLGWSKVGSMLMYEQNYRGFEDQFFKVYPDQSNRQANAVWRFAFEIKVGDLVISPSAATGFLLVGEIISEYLDDFDGQFGGQFGSAPYRHLRKVRWLYSIPANDPRHGKLNRIGMLAVARLDRTIEDVLAICNSTE